MSCRSGCPTPGAHRSYGECARAANIRVGQVDATAEKRWDAELNAYAAARAEGIQPAGTSMAKVRAAVEASDRAGEAFNAGSTVPILGGS